MENSFLKYDEFLFEKVWNKPIESSHLTDIQYDSKTKILEIEFWNGWRYRYKDVPESVFREFGDEKSLLGKIGSGIKSLLKKENKGTYGTRFWELIRRGDYDYERIK